MNLLNTAVKIKPESHSGLNAVMFSLQFQFILNAVDDIRGFSKCFANLANVYM